jgi:hypothetical protein
MALAVKIGVSHQIVKEQTCKQAALNGPSHAQRTPRRAKRILHGRSLLSSTSRRFLFFLSPRPFTIRMSGRIGSLRARCGRRTVVCPAPANPPWPIGYRSANGRQAAQFLRWLAGNRRTARFEAHSREADDLPCRASPRSCVWRGRGGAVATATASRE